MKSILKGAALAAALLSCAPSVKSIRLNPPPRAMAPKPAENVEVFTTSTPDRAYVEVAIFTATTTLRAQNGAALDGPAELIGSLRKQAATEGCDGLIVRPGSGDSYQGTCVVYK